MNRGRLLLAALALAAPGDWAWAQTALTLEVGQSRVIETAAPVARIVIDRSGVIGAKLADSRRVELTGDGAGQAGVTLVTRDRTETAYAVTVQPAGESAARALQHRLRTQPGLQGVAVSPSGDKLLLSGEVEDAETRARLAQLAPSGQGAPVVDMVRVTGPQMVAVDVRFYAISATTLKALGFNFSYLGGDIQGALLAPGSLQSFSLSPAGLKVEGGTPLQDAFNLLLANPKNGALGVLSALSDAGLSQVLAQPTLIVRSGQSADFLAGGDVPVPVPQGQNGAVAIEYRPYGVKLAVEPEVLSDRRIRLKVSPEVSELDYTNQVQIQGARVPGFRRRSTTTTVELGDGQSFVIAGLAYMSDISNEARTPGLASLPVIGALFKTSQVSRERQELIVVATPRLVSPLDHDPLEGVELDSKPADTLKRLGLSR